MREHPPRPTVKTYFPLSKRRLDRIGGHQLPVDTHTRIFVINENTKVSVVFDVTAMKAEIGSMWLTLAKLMSPDVLVQIREALIKINLHLGLKYLRPLLA